MKAYPMPTPDFSALDRFPAAQAYRDLLPGAPAHFREPEPTLTDPFTERHLHCVWYDDRLRPEGLRTVRGESLRVLRPGRWNFEAGPDFLDAEWEINGRRYCGDVEIHIRPMDWQHHGHAEDARYRNVRLHVTYESGSLPAHILPPGCEEVSLRQTLDARSHFFFDSIDLSAYPWEIDGGRHSLRALCAEMDEDHRGALLEAAGQERLRRKTLRMARAVQAVGVEQALYQAILRGLGYKQNADTAEELARRLPLYELRAESAGDPEPAYALLLGVAGLIPEPDAPGMAPPWLDVRPLWALWWRHRERYETRLLPRAAWRLDGCRPGNHPLRRLRAAANLFTAAPALETRLVSAPGEDPKRWIRRCQRLLCVTEPGGNTRLIGGERAAALLVNALLPWRAVTVPGEIPVELLRALPGEAVNARARQAAHSLFGPDHHPRLWRGTLRRQGLLQFHEDFGV